jgi:hypothetical protein
MLDKPLLQSVFWYTWSEYCEDEDPIRTIIRYDSCAFPPREGVPDNNPSHTLVLHIIILGQFAEEQMNARIRLFELVRNSDNEDLAELSKVPRKVLRDTGCIGNSNNQRYPLYKSALEVQRIINERIMWRRRREELSKQDEREEAERYNAEAAEECTDLVEANEEESEEDPAGDTEPDDESEIERAEAEAIADRQLAARREAEELEERAMAENLRLRGLTKKPKLVPTARPQPFPNSRVLARGNTAQSGMHGMDHMRAGIPPQAHELYMKKL